MMLVGDLTKIIEKYNKEEKDKIIIELYKRIPKRVKEDYDIDDYIITLSNKKMVKEEKIISIEELEKEINYFIQCVNSGWYATPNKIILKNERSKWRFKVKKYYKDLNNFLPGTIEGGKATDLLRELFMLLSLGTHILKFSNWETFRAIGIPQREFLGLIIKRKLSTGATKENLEYCVELLNAKYDPYELHSDMLNEFQSYLKTVDMKYTAIKLLNEQIIKWNQEIKVLKKEKKNSYYATEYINYFVECIVDIYFDLGEVDNGIMYFHKNYIEKNSEIKEYILLGFLEDFELYNEWILEYEKHMEKIDYRKSLKEQYDEFKKIDKELE